VQFAGWDRRYEFSGFFDFLPPSTPSAPLTHTLYFSPTSSLHLPSQTARRASRPNTTLYLIFTGRDMCPSGTHTHVSSTGTK